jgi:DNA-binding CsgD family transcriptional regulator
MKPTTTAPSDQLASARERARSHGRKYGHWRRGHALAARIVYLLSHGPHSRAQLAAELELSEMTVYRTMNFIRDDLGLPVSEANLPGVLTTKYHLTRPVKLCPLCLREAGH